jgi:hypothetical protein
VITGRADHPDLRSTGAGRSRWTGRTSRPHRPGLSLFALGGGWFCPHEAKTRAATTKSRTRMNDLSYDGLIESWHVNPRD